VCGARGSKRLVRACTRGCSSTTANHHTTVVVVLVVAVVEIVVVAAVVEVEMPRVDCA